MNDRDTRHEGGREAEAMTACPRQKGIMAEVIDEQCEWGWTRDDTRHRDARFVS